MMIRDVRPDDLQTYLKLTDRFYKSGAALHTENEVNTIKTFHACVEGTPFARALIFEKNGEPVGFMLLALTWSNEVGGMVVWLEELYICEEYQGQQLGSKALTWLFEEYQNFPRIRLEVCRSNAGAIRLYERYGFDFLDYAQYTRDKA